MKQIIFLLLTLSLFITSKSQICETQVDTTIYKYFAVEQTPCFPGGEDSLLYWIMMNVEYPSIVKAFIIQGTVYLSFIIDTNGIVSNIKVVKSADPVLDKAAIEVVSKLPKWIPGKQGSKNVNVEYIIPIKFQLDDGREWYTPIHKYNVSNNNKLGVEYYNLNAYKKAIVRFNMTINYDKKNIDAYKYRGLAKYKLGDKKGACDDWNKSISYGDIVSKNFIDKYCKE